MKHCLLVIISLLFLLVACTDYVGPIDERIEERNAHELARDESMVLVSKMYVEPCKTDTLDTCEYGTFKDKRDGQVYKTVTVGSQTWLAENLNYGAENSNCYDADAKNCAKYGRLYTWAVAMDSAGEFGSNGKGCGYGKLCAPTYPVKGVCPDGWHLPSYGEWHALFAAVEADSHGAFLMGSGSVLKSETGWDQDHNEDSYGFAVLPAGAWMDIEKSGALFYSGMESVAYFWMATEETRDEAYSFYIDSDSPHREMASKEYGYSVRCVKDVADKNPRSSGSAGEQNGGESLQSSSSIDESSVSCEPSDLWCKDNNYRVYISMDEYDDDSGYWWVEDDYAVDGASKIEWPVPRGNDYTELAFDPVIDYCKGLCGTAHLVKGGYYNNPFVAIGFDIPGAPVDVSDWGGVCITYTVDVPASLMLRLDPDKEAYLSSDVPTVPLSKESSATEKCFIWSDFKQAGWGMKEKISGNEAAKILRGLAFKIQYSDGTAAGFNIIRLRKADIEREPELSSSSSSIEYGTLVDSRDGRAYKTVTIGSQVWMAENLSYDAKGSYCRDDPDDCEKYGRYYTWAMAMDSVGEFSDNGLGCGYDTICEPTYPVRGICPEGWHLPRGGEFGTLIETAGGESEADEKLKSTSGWQYYENGEDAYGFNALPASRFSGYTGEFCEVGDYAIFWSSSGGSERSSANIFGLGAEDALAFTTDDSRYDGFSVRCVKD